MRRKVGFASVLAAGMLLHSAAAFGQAPPAQRPGERQQQSGETTLTGCLSPAGSGSFVLKTKQQGDVAVTGSDDFAKHSGHTVQLTGKLKQEQGKTTLQVTEVKHVTNTCQQ